MTITMEVQFAKVTCKCGGVYAITEEFRARCEKRCKSWHCPYCQVSWGYFGKTEAEKERARAERAEQQLRWRTWELEHTERRRRSEKAAKTRLKNRIALGMCPCCNETFKDLASHMAAEHPEEISTHA